MNEHIPNEVACDTCSPDPTQCCDYMSKLHAYLKSFKKPVDLTTFDSLIDAGIMPMECCKCSPNCDIFVFTNAAKFIAAAIAPANLLGLAQDAAFYTKCNKATIYNSSAETYASVTAAYGNVGEALIKPDCYYQDIVKLQILAAKGIIMFGDYTSCDNVCPDPFTVLWTVATQVFGSADVYSFMDHILSEGIVMWKSNKTNDTENGCCINLASLDAYVNAFTQV